MVAVVGVLALLTFRDYGLGWDDYTHAEYGDLLLSFYASGFNDQRALSFVNLYYYGGGFDLLAAPRRKSSCRSRCSKPAGCSARRSASVGLLVTWRIGRRIGGPLAGLLALALLATCPLYYGHMFMNPKDAPFAVAMAIFLLGAGARPSTNIRAVPLATGASSASASALRSARASWAPSAPIAALAGRWRLIFAVEARRRAASARPRVRLGHFLAGAPALHGAGLCGHGADLAVVRGRLRSIRSAPSNTSRISSKSPGRSCSTVHLVSVPDMPRSYVPTLFALKLPVILSARWDSAASVGALLRGLRSGYRPQPARGLSR